MDIHFISRSVSFVPVHWKFFELIFISYFLLYLSLVYHFIKLCMRDPLLFFRFPPAPVHFLWVFSDGLSPVFLQHFGHWWNWKNEVPSPHTAGSGYSSRKAEHMRGCCSPGPSSCGFRSQVRMSLHLVHDFFWVTAYQGAVV